MAELIHGSLSRTVRANDRELIIRDGVAGPSLSIHGLVTIAGFAILCSPDFYSRFYSDRLLLVYVY